MARGAGFQRRAGIGRAAPARAADVLYARVGRGIAGLPPACRPGINAARLLYAEIGREVERRARFGIAAGSRTGPRKAWVVMRDTRNLAGPETGRRYRPLDATRFLVEAVTGALARQPVPAAPVARDVPWWNPVDRIVWVIDLFERLERREQVERAGGR